MKKKSFLFYSGLIVFYSFNLFSPFSSIIFLSYFIAAGFFYLHTKDIRQSLNYSLVLSLFADIGRGGQYFMLEPESLGFGAGYFISPMTILLIFLIPLSFSSKPIRIRISDIFVLLFFLSFFISFIYFPYSNVLLGIISLSELILVYYIFRINFSITSIDEIQKIFVSMLLFQSVLGLGQYILGKPFGLIIESSTNRYPFGLFTAENETLFRIVGTFVHANNFAAVLLSLMPTIFYFRKKNKIIILILILSIIALIFTYTRSAWIIFVCILGIYVTKTNILSKLLVISKKIHLFAITIIFLILLFLLPLVVSRINTLSQTFSDIGSWSTRINLFKEGLNLVVQYPLTGVGLYRSPEVYISSPVTDLLSIFGSSRIYKFHNIYLEITAEGGIISLIFFILFLGSTFRHFSYNSKNKFKKSVFLGLIALTAISMLNPFFHSSQFRLFFLLAAIILA